MLLAHFPGKSWHASKAFTVACQCLKHLHSYFQVCCTTTFEALAQLQPHLDVIWVLFFIIVLATHEVGSGVAQVLEHLQGACQGLLCPAPLLHLGPCHLMGKFIL